MNPSSISYAMIPESTYNFCYEDLQDHDLQTRWSSSNLLARGPRVNGVADLILGSQGEGVGQRGSSRTSDVRRAEGEGEDQRGSNRTNDVRRQAAAGPAR